MTSPPTMTRRNLRLTILTHPFELAIGAALAINGVRGFFGDSSPSIDALPDFVRYLYLSVATVGGIGVVVGLILNDPPRHAGMGKTLERSSLKLLGSAYLALAFVIIGVNGWDGAAQGLVSALLGAACFARARAILKAANVILEQLTARNDAVTHDEREEGTRE